MDVVSSFYRSYKKLFLSLSKRLNGLPIIIFYKYLYANDKPLLVQGLVVNYILPMVLEILPFWWVSSRKLGNRLRKTKIQLNHSMATGKLLNMRMLVEFLVLTVFHAVLDTAKQHLQNRTAIENRLLIRRLVFERLLYSEMGEFEKLRTLDIEYRISADISQTLSFFTYTLPQVVGSVYALVREGLELYRHRQHVDLLALLHPIAIGVLRKILGYFKYHLIEKKQRDVIHKTRTKMSRLVSNALDGLADIQVNNLQQHQLRLLDAMISTELSNSLGIKTLVARTWNLFSNRNVLEFVAEVYVVHKVMQRQQISHETYSKIQHDIHRVIDLAKRLYGLVRITRNMLEFQKEVVELVNIPNFLDEHKRFKTHIVEFRELRLTDVVFAYKDDAPPALCFSGSLVFEQGKQYAVIGQNRSGKSTLCKLICKLYQPMQGSISINDIPYNRISRVALRELISYVSQKPFLFPGTIRDNILIGNPDATEQEVYDAAEAAGVFAYGAYMLDATGGGMRRSVSMNDMKGSWRPSTPTPVPTSLSPPAEVSTPSPSLPIGPPTFSRGRSEATLRRSLPPAVDPLDEDDPLTNPGAAALHPGDCEEEDVDHPDKTGTDAHASVEDSEEGGGLLYKAVNLVWEAEADFHSTYLRKKKKKDRDKEKKRLRFSTAPGRATHDEVPAGPGAAILDMKLTARGGNISGGFAQSVALARVFVKTKARVVILDEALGQMDPYKKRGIIYPALLRFVRRWGMTLIIVSHDMQSIEGVDVIYLLHQGALAHSGSHDQLLRDRAPLYLQMLGLDTEDDSEEGQEAPSGDSMAGDSQGDKRDTKGKARAASADRPFEGNGTAITSSKPPQSPRRVTFSPLPPRTSED